MRALRFAVIAALISVSVVEGTDAFARSAGNGGAGAAGGTGGAAGGASGGTSGGGGGATHGVVADFATVANPPARGPTPRIVLPLPKHVYGSCYKEDHLYDRYGDPVVNLRGLDCFGG